MLDSHLNKLAEGASSLAVRMLSQDSPRSLKLQATTLPSNPLAYQQQG